jgi:hypothetical protein
MNEIEYVWKIEQLIRSIDNISEEMLDVLSLFIFHNHLSIYQIHKVIAKYGRKKIAYKNSRQKVQKLIDLKLIEKEIDVSKFQIKELEKGAIFYKLSKEGIFALFNKSSIFLKPSIYYVQQALENGKTIEDMYYVFAEYKKEIFKNHQNSSFFELFVFPWISLKTIENANERLIDNIILTLNEFCIIYKEHILISDDIDILKNSEEIEYLSSELIRGHNIQGSESVNMDDKDLLSYIQNTFTEPINRVIIKRGDNKSKFLLFEPTLHDFLEKRKLLLAYKDKEDRSNVISFYENTEGSLFNYELEHIQILHPMFNKMDLKSLYFKAIFSIVMGLFKKDYNVKLLKEDTVFMNTLSELKEKFNEGIGLLAN